MRKILLVWDVKTRKREALLKQHEGPVNCVAFSPDGSTLASGGADRAIVLWRNEPPAGTPSPTSSGTTEPSAPPPPLGAEHTSDWPSPEQTPDPASAAPGPPPETPMPPPDARPEPPEPETKILPPEAFKITGMMGEIGTEDVTVTFDGNLVVDVGQEFDFQYKGKTYRLKLVSTAPNKVEILQDGQTITVPYKRPEEL